MNQRLKDKVAIITGAANGMEGKVMGIGGAAARLFIQEGASVVLADIDINRGIETAEQIQGLLKGDQAAIFMELDVSIESQWSELVKATTAKFGKIDILVHSAGNSHTASVENTTEEDWDRQFNVHSKGIFLGTKYVLPVMRKNGGGSIVILSSMDAMIGASGGTAYSAAKGSSRTFAKVAAIQLAKDKIRVNSVHPGYTDTPLARAAIDRITADGSTDPRIPRIPMGRLAQADEIAKAILFLACDESSYITGSELVIDGGVTAQ